MGSVTYAAKNTVPGTNIVIKKKSLFKEIKKHKEFYLFLLPAIILTFAFSYKPYVWITMAFQDFKIQKGLFGSHFVGLQNFKAIIDNPNFIWILKNTIEINVLGFIFGFPAPILFALLINELRGKYFKKITQTITYLPHFISWVIVAGMAYNILNEDTGVLNAIREFLGLGKIAYLRTPGLFKPIIIIMSIWKEIGWSSIIYLAALTSIDQEQYEAATVDGATELQKVFYITLPGLAPAISIMLILAAGTLISGGGMVPGFDAIYNMTNPMINSAAETIPVFNYEQGELLGKYSFATALDLIQSFIAFILVFIANSISKKLNGYGVY